MSKAPERIWIDEVYGQHPEDWYFTDGKHLTKRQIQDKVEYVRADRIEELEAKLAKAMLVVEMLASADVDAVLGEAVDISCEIIGDLMEDEDDE